MKTLFILISLIIFCPDLFPQYKLYPTQNVPFPGRFTHRCCENRIDAERITWDVFDAEGNPITYLPDELYPIGAVEIKKSFDLSQDTIKVLWGLITEYITEYSPDGKILFCIYKDSPTGDTFFEYDSQGRIITEKRTGYIIHSDNSSTVSSIKTTSYDYIHNTISIHVKYFSTGEENEIVSYIKYTDNGYIMDTNGTESQYIFDSQNRLIQTDNTEYTYIEDGYIETINHKGRPTERNEYHFTDDTYLSKIIKYKYSENEWDHYTTTIYTYHKAHTSANKVPGTKPIPLSTAPGMVSFELQESDFVHVYLANGELIKKEFFLPGNHQLLLSAGLYIVVINNRSYKIWVP